MNFFKTILFSLLFCSPVLAEDQDLESRLIAARDICKARSTHINLILQSIRKNDDFGKQLLKDEFESYKVSGDHSPYMNGQMQFQNFRYTTYFKDRIYWDMFGQTFERLLQTPSLSNENKNIQSVLINIERNLMRILSVAFGDIYNILDGYAAAKYEISQQPIEGNIQSFKKNPYEFTRKLLPEQLYATSRPTEESKRFVLLQWQLALFDKKLNHSPKGQSVFDEETSDPVVFSHQELFERVSTGFDSYPLMRIGFEEFYAYYSLSKMFSDYQGDEPHRMSKTFGQGQEAVDDVHKTYTLVSTVLPKGINKHFSETEKKTKLEKALSDGVQKLVAPLVEKKSVVKNSQKKPFSKKKSGGKSKKSTESKNQENNLQLNAPRDLEEIELTEAIEEMSLEEAPSKSEEYEDDREEAPVERIVNSKKEIDAESTEEDFSDIDWKEYGHMFQEKKRQEMEEKKESKNLFLGMPKIKDSVDVLISAFQYKYKVLKASDFMTCIRELGGKRLKGHGNGMTYFSLRNYGHNAITKPYHMFGIHMPHSGSEDMRAGDLTLFFRNALESIGLTKEWVETLK